MREFREETGLHVEDWNPYVELSGDDFNVTFFYATVSNEKMGLITTTTDEEVFVVRVDPPTPGDRINLTSTRRIPNLSWLIPMALSIATKQESAQGFHVREFAIQEEAANSPV